jgi:hypothetical protein
MILKLFTILAALLLFSCPFYFHPNCIRSIHGNIQNSSGLKFSEIRLLIRDATYIADTTTWYSDTVQLDSKGEFSLKDFYVQAEIKCEDGCSENWSIPRSVQVKVLNYTDKSTLLDTVYHCESYVFEPDAIRLRNIPVVKK